MLTTSKDPALFYQVHTTSTGGQTDPDGTSKAVRVTEATGNTAHEITSEMWPPSPPGIETRLECYVKNDSGSRWLWLDLSFIEGQTEEDWYAFFKPVDGSRGTVFASSGKAELLVDEPVSGWYHIVLVVKGSDKELNTASIGLSDVDDGLAYSGDGTSGVLVYDVRCYRCEEG